MKMYIDRYRNQTLVVRIVAAIVIGAAVAWFGFFSTEFETTQTEYDTAKENMETTKSAFERAKSNLETHTEEELMEEGRRLQVKIGQIQKKLPERFVMEEIIYFVTNAAEESNIKLTSFTPQAPSQRGGSFVYYELPITMNIEGTYKQSGIFFDKISHMKDMVHIKNVKMSQFSSNENRTPQPQSTNPEQNSLQDENVLLKLSRTLASYKVKASFQMVVFSTSSI